MMDFIAEDDGDNCNKEFIPYRMQMNVYSLNA